jgi:DNA-binding GntR family transcriptional regulator
MTALEGAFNTRTINEAVYRRLRAYIVEGGIPLGSRLDERTLAARMGVSRTPVRDAIAKLAFEGIVAYRPHAGSFVRDLTPREVDDLYAVRQELEGLAVRLAVANRTPEFLAALTQAVDGCQAALRDHDLAAFAEDDRRMHELFVLQARNEWLTDCLSRVGTLIQLARNLANRHPGLPETTDEERHDLLRAVRDGDADRASEFMKTHIESVRAAVVSELGTGG